MSRQAEADEFRILKAQMDKRYLGKQPRLSKEQMRKRSDLDIEKYNQLAVADEQEIEHEYQSEYRGKVQNRRVALDYLPMYTLSYELEPNQVKQYVAFDRLVDAFNARERKQHQLHIINSNPILDEQDTKKYFAYIDSLTQQIDRQRNERHLAPLLFRRAIAPMPKAADELFDDFIFNFAANKKLQSSRVKFPLKVLRGEEVTYVSKGQWQMEYFFMNQDFYTLLFNSEDEMNRAKESTSIEHAVVEKIYLDAKTVKQFVFDRVKGVWMLQEVIHMPLSESQNASFLMFYDKFSKDEDAYQSKHLAESVRFVGPDPDDDFAQMEGVITPDTWEAFAPELPSGMIYNIVYGTPQKETGRKIFVLRGIANGMEMELTFKHEGDKWILTKLAT